jgi:Predicted metal-dependent hydrolase
MVEYKIIRSKRKTAGIYILPDATVEVRCPNHTPIAYIEAFVRQKETWILQKVSEKQAEQKQKTALVFSENTNLLFLGKEYPLHLIEEARAGFHGDYFYCYAKCENPKETLVEVYRKLAERILVQKAQEFSETMNCKPIKIKINSAKTRWGSCSGKNSINFSYKLIMAEETAVDYVVVHELSHMIEHNHSKQFWNIVESILPDYKRRKSSLKTLQKRLLREGWET